MSRSRVEAVILAIAAAFAAGCDLLDLAGLGVAIHPSGQGSVLPAGEEAWVEFFEPVDALSAERTLSFASQRGGVEADYRWEGSRLIAAPRVELERGVRYTITVKGRVRKENGNFVDVDEESSFYYATSEPLPTLASGSPAAGAVVAVDAVVELRFSTAMDRESAQEAFSLSPSADCAFSWPSDDVMIATPVEPLDALVYYTWKLANTAKTTAGLRFWSQQSGTFYTAADYERPYVVSVSRASWDVASSEYIAPVPGMSDGLMRGEVLLVEFSEPVDTADASAAIRVETAFRGSVVPVTAARLAFVPEAANKFGASYTIVVPKEIPDLAGIPMGEDYRLTFSAADMSLDIVSVGFQTDGGIPVTVPGTDLSTSSPIVMSEYAPAFDAVVTITFSHPFVDGASRAKVVDSVLFDPYFPSGAPSPTLFSVNWMSDSAVTLHYQGVEGAASSGSNFYKLVIPKGIRTDASGDYYFDTVEDAWAYVEMRGD